MNVESDRIVTACVVQCGGDQPTASANWLADPGIEIPEDAAKLHGITTARARAEGAPAGEVVEQVVAALVQVVSHGIPIVIMNAPFDLTMLDREARRHGIPPLVDTIDPSHLLVVDPKVLDKQTSPRRKGPRKLKDLCHHYRVRLDRAHSSDADAIAACRVVWRIADQHQGIRNTPLPELHQQQIAWAARQAADLRDYFVRTPGKQDRAATVRPEWPLIPFKQTPEVRDAH